MRKIWRLVLAIAMPPIGCASTTADPETTGETGSTGTSTSSSSTTAVAKSSSEMSTATTVTGDSTGATNPTGESTTTSTSGSDSESTTAAADSSTSESTGEASWCVAHCECMAATCATVPGYPWRDAADCLATCATWGAGEQECFPMWCEEASEDPGLSQHLCEHAWNEFGLDECG